MPRRLRRPRRRPQPPRALRRAGRHPTALLSHLRDDPAGHRCSARTFGASTFMAEILIRHPAWFYWLAEPEVLGRARDRTEDIERDLTGPWPPCTPRRGSATCCASPAAARSCTSGCATCCGSPPCDETVGALSRLAEALIDRRCEGAEAACARRVGLPPLADREPGRAPPRAGLRGAGHGQARRGRAELQLRRRPHLRLRLRPGTAGGAAALRARHEFFAGAGPRLTAALGDVPAEGYVYRVDLRLRPEGRVGAARPVARAPARTTTATRGATWERLALLKAWPVAGDRALGARFLERVRALRLRPALRTRRRSQDVRRVKRADRPEDRAARDESHRQREARASGGSARSSSPGPGPAGPFRAAGIRSLRERDTLAALDALRAARACSPPKSTTRSSQAYLFLRDVENKLQMVSDAQVHCAARRRRRSCAPAPCASAIASRRGSTAEDALLADYRAHTEATHRIFEDVLASVTDVGPKLGRPISPEAAGRRRRCTPSRWRSTSASRAAAASAQLAARVAEPPRQEAAAPREPSSGSSRSRALPAHHAQAVRHPPPEAGRRRAGLGARPRARRPRPAGARAPRGCEGVRSSGCVSPVLDLQVLGRVLHVHEAARGCTSR